MQAILRKYCCCIGVKPRRCRVCHAIWPISCCETAHIVLRNGPFRSLKWAVSQYANYQCVTPSGAMARKRGVKVWKIGAEGERKVGCDGAEKRVRCGREGRRVRKKWGAMAWKRGVESVGRWAWVLLQPVAYRHGVCPYAAVPSAYIGVCGVGECQTVLAEVVVVDVVE